MAEEKIESAGPSKLALKPPFWRDAIKLAIGAEIIAAAVFRIYSDSRIAQAAFLLTTFALLVAVLRRRTPGFDTAKGFTRSTRVKPSARANEVRRSPTATPDAPPTREELLKARAALDRDLEILTESRYSQPELVERLKAMIEEIDESLADMDADEARPPKS